MIKLERSADKECAQLAGLTGEADDTQWRRWREASEKVQAAVTAHAESAESNRHELEQAVKKAVRHAQQEGLLLSVVHC
ncbi:hypothetical protein C3492_39525 [Streptomyces sp. Ru62]|nr:hypothetical protein C3492_39525 [Streptomyces sp. Ru62]